MICVFDYVYSLEGIFHYVYKTDSASRIPDFITCASNLTDMIYVLKEVRKPQAFFHFGEPRLWRLYVYPSPESVHRKGTFSLGGVMPRGQFWDAPGGCGSSEGKQLILWPFWDRSPRWKCPRSWRPWWQGAPLEGSLSPATWLIASDHVTISNGSAQAIHAAIFEELPFLLFLSESQMKNVDTTHFLCPHCPFRIRRALIKAVTSLLMDALRPTLHWNVH